MAAPTSLLTPSGERLLPYLPLALAGHLGFVALLVVVEVLIPEGPKSPLIHPDDAIQVALVAMPKSATPQRAQKAPAPRAAETNVAAPPEPAPTPPPPRQSEMAIRTPDPTPAATPAPERAEAPARQGVADDERELSALMAELERERLLAELGDAPTGPVDRAAASPDGVEGASAASRSGIGVGDPEYARYVQQVAGLFLEHFRPLPALTGTALKATVLVSVDASGRVTAREVYRSSGNPFWDRAALAATEAVSSIPLPPEKYRDGETHSYEIHFEDP